METVEYLMVREKANAKIIIGKTFVQGALYRGEIN